MTTPPTKTSAKLYGYAFTLVMAITTLVLYIARATREHPAEDSVILASVGTMFQAAWGLLSEGLRLWAKLKGKNTVLMGMVAAGFGTAAIATGEQGCASSRTLPERDVGVTYDPDPDAPPPACILRLYIDGREAFTIHRPQCPQEPNP